MQAYVNGNEQEKSLMHTSTAHTMTDTLPHIIIPPEWLRGIPDILDWQDKGGRQFPHLEELWPTPTRSAACTFTSLLKLPYSNKPNFGERKINSGFYYYCGLKDTILGFIQFSLTTIYVHISLLLNQKSPSHFLTYCYPVRIALVFGIFGRLILID